MKKVDNIVGAKLEAFVGISGETTDKAFELIADLLAEHGNVTDEKEQMAKIGRPTSALITTIYQVADRQYELWYQVRTPFSPKNMTLTFGFNRTKEQII